MQEIVIIQRMVKQNQKNIMKITKKGFKKKRKIFQKKKRTKNMEEIDTGISLRRIKKNWKNT